MQEFLENAALNAPIGICLIDAVSLIPEMVNDKFAEVAGRSRDHLLQRPYWESFAEVRSLYEDKLATVIDTGVAFRAEDEDLSHIFERFYRVQTNRHVSGFGIGLYICAEIIQRHDGRVWAESRFGKGSSFYFTLPLPVDDPAQAGA